jgi:hypothetical protein
MDLESLQEKGLTEEDALELTRLETERDRAFKTVQDQIAENVAKGKDPGDGIDLSFVRETQIRIDRMVDKIEHPPSDQPTKEVTMTPQASSKVAQFDVDGDMINQKVDRGMSLLPQMGDDVSKVMDRMMSEAGGDLSDEEWQVVENQLTEFVDSLEAQGSLKKEAPGSTFRALNDQRHQMTPVQWGDVEDENRGGIGEPKSTKRDRPIGYLQEYPDKNKPVTSALTPQDAFNIKRDDILDSGVDYRPELIKKEIKFTEEQIEQAKKNMKSGKGTEFSVRALEGMLAGWKELLRKRTSAIVADSEVEGELDFEEGKIPDMELRARDGRVRIMNNYKEVVVATSEMLNKIIRGKEFKGTAAVLQSNLIRIKSDDVSDDGVVRNGSAEWAMTMEYPIKRVKKKAYITFNIREGDVYFPNKFADGLGRTFPLTKDGITTFLG